MEREFLRQAMQQEPMIQRCKIHPFTREFLADLRFITQRTVDGPRISGPGYTMTAAEGIMKLLLTREERRAVFPSPYDLGSGEVLEPRQQALSEILVFLGKGDKDPEDVVKAIRSDIRKWTGFGFGEFVKVDGSVAAKVLCLLYRFRTTIYKRLPTLLEPPQARGKASFEFRDAWPVLAEGRSFELATRNMAVLADLKANLASEMPPQYDRLREILQQAQVGKDRVLPGFAAARRGYAVSREKACALVATLLPAGVKTRPARLDVELFLFLTLLELEHTRVATDSVVAFIASDAAAIPMADRPVRDPEWLRPDTALPRDELQRRVERISGLALSPEAMARAWRLSDAVFACIDRGTAEGASLLERVAAIVAVLGDVERLSYKIWWKGQTEISFRPVHYLEHLADAGEEVWPALRKIPGGYLEFWFQRYMRILYWCLGLETGWRDANAAASNELASLVEVFRTHDLDEAIRHAEAYLRACTVQAIRPG